MKEVYTIKESPSESFFVKTKNSTVAAFHKKEHAELFIKILQEQDNKKQTATTINKS